MTQTGPGDDGAAESTVAVSVVMLAYGDEPVLEEALAAVTSSTGVRVEMVLVDNGCTRADVDDLCRRHGVRLLRPGSNLGFTGGVNLGVAATTSPYVALVNSDAIVAPDAVKALQEVAADPGVGIASGSIRLAEDPTTMNSAGNPVHFLGLGWAGGLGEPAARHALPRDVAAASGAGIVLRRSVWDALGGFPAEFFAYQEDLELSWRCWQRGLAVRYVPGAVVVHHYEFSRNPLKMYLLERNRLLFVLTCYGRRTLMLLAPVLLAFEVAMLVVAGLQGWGRKKVRGWGWVLSHLGWIRRRRQQVQAARTVPDADLVHLWADRFTAAAMPLPRGAGVLQAALAVYWSLVRRVL
ncbi:glycosyltransferase family 2 protein [Actinotalea sp. K2]|uniref:glycosyltransferase family 2 protein n=1 Tax=Actinotalea sp. K2 TaxID=2939438 RepID=UPI002018336B|nr:glycosyltransferase family 2 protein [Actinotalea sp. K2]MCL3862702.1 glycosyltransferase family 2 protein [Actinotalea sp. K2]